jgi:ATP-dependent helicase/nuclease subunit B
VHLLNLRIAGFSSGVRLNFYSQVAQHILSCHAQDLPDLRGAMVLLPNYHAAQPLAQALGEMSGFPALLLPPMTTLADWALSVPVDDAIQSDTRRIASLYQALREHNWFPDADLWSLSRELLTLMDELTRHHVVLPESAEEFAQQLTAAYQARSGEAMQFEARVVHELWYAMAANDDLDTSRAYQLRLAQLAQQVAIPVYVLQTCDLPVIDMRFLDACRMQVEVTLFDTREMAASQADCALLSCALQQDLRSADLLSTAKLLASQTEAVLNAASTGSGGCPTKSFTGRAVRLFGAHGMEQEAEAADVQVRRWLLEGRQSIAVVVQDRLVARRLRALLERAQVQVQDETGWTFATLAVSTVLMRWLEAVQGDFYYQDVLDLLKSPFLFADNPAQRKQAAYQFEQLVRKHGVVAHLQDFIAVAERESAELIQPLARLRQAARLMPNKRVPLADWLHALHESLDILGIIQGWRQDAAGQQLMQLLALWQDELQSDTTACDFAEWRRWLSQQLDLNTYRDLSVDSPVLFTHLPATRWRRFDAVLLLGCDAMHLPAPSNAGQWFNDAVRATLGLPLAKAQQLQARDDLLALLALNSTVLISWQAGKNGEPNLLSPHLEMLRALHLLAFKHDLMDTELAELIPLTRVRSEDRGSRIEDRGLMPSPIVLAELIPQRISPSGYNSLVACPYQYFARHVLRLNELDEVREELDKRDYGTWVHAVLQRFHTEIPVLQTHDQADAELVMQRISREVFAGALAHDYLAQAWLLRWQALIPAYLTWQLENEDAGWRYQGSEVSFKIDVTENLQLGGRLDRVDEYLNEPANLSVIDYKTQSIQILKNKLKEPGEDVQLACYSSAVSASAAIFVSLEDEIVLAVAPGEDIVELAELNLDRLKTVFAQLRDGVGLPAHGAEKICGYCEMKGLCRSGEWQETENGKPQTEKPKPETENGVDHG